MPIYEYQCESCQSQFELLIRSQAAKPACPQCGGADLEKLLSVPSAHVQGASLPVCEAPRQKFCGQGGCGMPECRAD